LTNIINSLYGENPDLTQTVIGQIPPLEDGPSFLEEDEEELGPDPDPEPADSVIELAMITLSRAVECLRPGGLLEGTVSKTDYRDTYNHLNIMMHRVRKLLNPDESIPIKEWTVLDTHGREEFIHPKFNVDDDDDDDDDPNEDLELAPTDPDMATDFGFDFDHIVVHRRDGTDEVEYEIV